VSRFEIAPSILSADFGKLAAEVRMAELAGGDRIHVDVMDGHFVPNITIGPDVVGAIARVATTHVDVHLMIEEPDRYIETFVAQGAQTVGVHVEACPHLHRTLQLIRSAGARPSVVLNPATPAESIREVLPLVDQVLCMTVNPGFGGQAFIRETLPKIQTIAGWIRQSGLSVDLEVDGGIGLDTVEDVALHGANVFVMGSAFFKSGDPKRFVEEIRARLAPIDSKGI
jgi:ribulose-phosphate 3-epimerase